jgi:hypothetical protein
MDAIVMWSNYAREEYDDYQCTLNKNQFVFCKPNKRRDRDHLIRIRALYCLKTKKGWRFIGHLTQTHEIGDNQVCVTVNRWGPERYYPNKNALLEAMGFNPISDYERMHGLTPVTFRN